MAKIRGGYYIKARCIKNSFIATAPPHVREIWDYLIREANHKDKKIEGTIIKRGQLLRTYQDIRDDLAWKVGWRLERYSKWDCERAMKVLKKATMIATTKTTRGMVITVLQYDKFQTPENYESHNENHRRATIEPQSRHTINKNVKNEKKERNTKVLVASQQRGRQDINLLLIGLEKILGVLDGTIREQRNFCKLFLDSKMKKIFEAMGKKEWTEEQLRVGVLRIATLAMQNDFHRKNANSIKYLYKHAGSIINEQTGQSNSIIKI